MDIPYTNFNAQDFSTDITTRMSEYYTKMKEVKDKFAPFIFKTAGSKDLNGLRALFGISSYWNDAEEMFISGRHTTLSDTACSITVTNSKSAPLTREELLVFYSALVQNQAFKHNGFNISYDTRDKAFSFAGTWQSKELGFDATLRFNIIVGIKEANHDQ